MLLFHSSWNVGGQVSGQILLRKYNPCQKNPAVPYPSQDEYAESSKARVMTASQTLLQKTTLSHWKEHISFQARSTVGVWLACSHVSSTAHYLCPAPRPSLAVLTSLMFAWTGEHFQLLLNAIQMTWTEPRKPQSTAMKHGGFFLDLQQIIFTEGGLSSQGTNTLWFSS